ncbi:MAG: alpha/beta hydrolase [Candidatus Limnocylindrales bacterium]
MIWLVAGVVIVALGAMAALVGMYVATGGDDDVPPTVDDDPSLPRVIIDGHAFHAETHGDPGARVLLVLHGGPGADYRSLEALSRLADSHRVVFFDQRGAGLSGRVPADQLTFESAVEDVHRFVERFGRGEPVDLVGHSWGGTLAAAYLARATGLVRRAVLAEPGYLSADELRAWRTRYRSLMSGPGYLWLAAKAGFEAQHIDGPDDHAAKDFLVGERIIPFFVSHPDNPYRCPATTYDAPRWRWGSAASDVLGGPELEAPLDRIRATASSVVTPILFLAGACDTWIGPELQRRHASWYPDARLGVIDHAGHDIFWDQPDASIEATRAFLAAL